MPDSGKRGLFTVKYVMIRKNILDEQKRGIKVQHERKSRPTVNASIWGGGGVSRFNLLMLGESFSIQSDLCLKQERQASS